ncbi:hypothetical protein [Cupriavidus sp. L7L]|uniref:hypothetical protein n=1 Tax=Cupriavidus sp. L7L TaxID=2546443 RepID=UPI001054CCF7|nr:hypothetical protein [Cupriavidus sp. L7L]TDF58127.1 hypothetical protein E1J61_35625 [Cupriavidus sp. L7L]
MESFANNLIKRPLKLFAFCMALYLASQSFIVGVFIAVVAFFYSKEKTLQWSRAVPAAPKVSMPEHTSMPKPSHDQPAEPSERKYERSAVVTPIRRTGTHDRS